jgi:hypothetical protein
VVSELSWGDTEALGQLGGRRRAALKALEYREAGGVGEVSQQLDSRIVAPGHTLSLPHVS